MFVMTTQNSVGLIRWSITKQNMPFVAVQCPCNVLQSTIQVYEIKSVTTHKRTATHVLFNYSVHYSNWRSWNCCDRRTRFVVIRKLILSTGTRIRIDSVMRPGLLVGGAVQVPQLLQLQYYIIAGPSLPLPATVLRRHVNQPISSFFHCRWCLRDGELSRYLLTWLGLYDDGCAADTT